MSIEERIQAAIRADATRGREVERIGPFVATFNRTTENPYLNYAIPEPGAAPSASDVEKLVDAYARRGRTPRLEYVPGLAPAVEPVLLEGDFAVEDRLPLMTCTGRPKVSAPPGIELVHAVTAEDIRGAATAQWEAYGEEGSPGEGWLRGLAGSIEAGGLLVLARDAETGDPAGGGQCTAPHDGATELTSIGVRPMYRRRGIAGAMAAWLAATVLDRGTKLVFLMAHGEPEANKIYAPIGFARIGEVLHISRNATDPS